MLELPAEPMSDVPIRDHALLSDCRSAALVTAQGSADWLCLPRFDSAPLFGRLLDRDAGHFLIAPAADGYSVRWRYLRSSLVLQTTWSSASGDLVVTDALALGAGERGHALGASAPGALLKAGQMHPGVGRGSRRVRASPRVRADPSETRVLAWDGSFPTVELVPWSSAPVCSSMSPAGGRPAP